ncbi:unnamed protein product, partial [Amoebophrya sp. A120]
IAPGVGVASTSSPKSSLLTAVGTKTMVGALSDPYLATSLFRVWSLGNPSSGGPVDEDSSYDVERDMRFLRAGGRGSGGGAAHGAWFYVLVTLPVLLLLAAIRIYVLYTGGRFPGLVASLQLRPLGGAAQAEKVAGLACLSGCCTLDFWAYWCCCCSFCVRPCRSTPPAAGPPSVTKIAPKGESQKDKGTRPLEPTDRDVGVDPPASPHPLTLRGDSAPGRGGAKEQKLGGVRRAGAFVGKQLSAAREAVASRFSGGARNRRKSDLPGEACTLYHVARDGKPFFDASEDSGADGAKCRSGIHDHDRGRVAPSTALTPRRRSIEEILNDSDRVLSKSPRYAWSMFNSSQGHGQRQLVVQASCAKMQELLLSCRYLSVRVACCRALVFPTWKK